jgi:hypothetical protein
MPLFRRFRERRAIVGGAKAYVARIITDPASDDADWLSTFTNGDLDHASWELRYLRFAIGLITARQHSLEDRLPAVVSHELMSEFARDKRIASPNLSMAESQFNARLRSYTEAFHARALAEPWERRIGRALLEFTGLAPRDDAAIERAARIAASYFDEAAEALRTSFGVTTLPEHIAPSEALGLR